MKVFRPDPVVVAREAVRAKLEGLDAPAGDAELGGVLTQTAEEVQRAWGTRLELDELRRTLAVALPTGAERPDLAAHVERCRQILASKTDLLAGVALANTQRGLGELVGVAKRRGIKPMEALGERRGFVASAASAIWGGLQKLWRAAAPGPTERVGLPTFATRVLRHYRSPVEFFDWIHRKHGVSAEVRLAGRAILFDHDYEVMKAALSGTDRKDGANDFKKVEPLGHGVAFLIGPQNIFLSGGAEWKETQAVLQPVLSPGAVNKSAFMARMQDAVDAMTQTLAAEAARSPDGEIEVDADQVTKRLTLDVALRALFNLTATPARLDELQRALTVFNDWLTTESLNLTPVSVSALAAILPAARPLRDAYATLQGFAEELIAARAATRGSGPGPAPGAGDVLDALLGARNGAGAPFSEERLRNEVLSLLIAGHETTSSALSWSLHMLARDPGRQQRLYEDARAIGSRPVRPAELKAELAYTQGAFEDTLRLFAPKYLMARQAVRDVVVGSGEQQRRIAKGTIVMMSTFHANRDPATWGEAATGYHEERWAPERYISLEDGKPVFKPGNRNLAYGLGSRRCLGAAMANAEGAIAMIRLSQTFEIGASGELGIKADLSTHPSGSKLRLKLRQPAAQAASA